METSHPNDIHACCLRGSDQRFIERRDGQSVTDRQFEVRGVVHGEFVTLGERPNVGKHSVSDWLFYFDRQIAQSRRPAGSEDDRAGFRSKQSLRR